jgi:hypothetical protein
MANTDDSLAAELAAEALAASPDAPEGSTLERMEQLAAEVNDIDDRIAKNMARVKELQDRRFNIMTSELIELMDEAHVQMVQVGGRKFQAQPYYKAVIPVAEQDHPGYTWLEEHDAGDLIKNVVTAEFPKGADSDARLAEDLIRKRFQMASVFRKREVHHMTLTAWLKEMHQSTDPDKVMPPLDVIGGSMGRIVKITNSRE